MNTIRRSRVYWLLLSTLVVLLMITSICVPYVHAEGESEGTIIYVDGSKKDGGNGSSKKPFNSIQRAQEYIKNDSSNETHYTVKIAGGTYELDETFTIDVNNIKKGASVTYQAKELNDYPVLSGGKHISGKWVSEGKGIYSIELNRDKKLRALYVNGNRCYMTSKTLRGIGKSGEYTVTAGSKDWAWLGGTIYSQVRFTAKAIPATTRNQDDIEMVSKSTWNTTTVCAEKVESTENATIVTMQMPYGALAQTLGWGNEFQFMKDITVYNVFEWLKNPGEFYFDKTAHKLYYYPREGEDLNKADVVVPNLDSIIEIKGENKENKVSNITFENLIVQYTDWNLMEVDGSFGRGTNQANAVLNAYAHKTKPSYDGEIIWHNDVYRSYDMGPAAISITSADNITLKNLIVRHTGNEGITLLNDVSNTKITGCGIYDTGASAIVVGHPQHMFIGDKGSDIGYFSEKEKYSQDEEALCKNIVIEKSKFTDLCKLFPGCPGVTIYAADTFDIVDNFMKNVPYCGISVGWGWWNMNGDSDSVAPGIPTESINAANVSRNRIEDALQILSDGGAIYTLGEMRGSRVDENYIKGIGSEINAEEKIRGIHMDEGTRHLLGDKNVIEVAPKYACVDCGNWGRKGYNTWTNTYSTSKKNSTEPNMEEGTTCPVIYVADANWPQEAMAVVNNAGTYDTLIDNMINFETYYNSNINVALIVGLSIGGVVVLAGIGFCTYWFLRKKKRTNSI